MPKPEGTVVITLYVLPELRKRFKTACTGREKNMVEVLQQLMEEYATEYELKLQQDKKT